MLRHRTATAVLDIAHTWCVPRCTCAFLQLCAALSVVAVMWGAAAHAGSVAVSDARVPATASIGADVPLTMTIVNQSAQPDALLRVRCPFANFSERYTVDYGEGAPSARAVPSIPLPAGATVALTTKSYHVMLLQTREPLSEGQTMTCSAAFRGAGAIDVAVHVMPTVTQP